MFIDEVDKDEDTSIPSFINLLEMGNGKQSQDRFTPYRDNCIYTT